MLESRTQPATLPNTPGSLRRKIIFLLFLLIAICILDRQILSVLAPILTVSLHLSNTQYGAILFCFLAGMTIGQIPVGIMIDRIGARKGFVIIFCVWSLASVGHAFMHTAAQFGALRFLLGLAECGAYSGGTKVIAQWFPPEDRAFAAGIFNSGSLAGSIVAPPLIVFLALHLGWRAAFILPSLAGVLWVIPWLRTYWEPWQHPALRNEAHDRQPRTSHEKAPSILHLLTFRAVWGAILMRAFSAPVTNFYWYWLPEYLKHQRGMTLAMIGLVTWLPFLAGGIGNLGGGWAARHLVRRGCSIDTSRRVLFIISITVAASAVLVPAMPNNATAIGLICLASLAINAYAANLIGLYTDLFPHEMLARITSMTGIGDGIMSMMSMLFTGIVVDHFSFLPVFVAAGLLPFLALGSFFVLVRRVRPVPIGIYMQPE
ncbi:MAG TPA: MFS transporter [Bryocella sp.]|nr:MFS transporter [Bryocella sp.]